MIKKPPVKREFMVNYNPSPEIRKGNIFVYTGSEKRLLGTLGLLLVHDINPQHEFKAIRQGTEVFEDIAIVEVMPSDYCRFWVEKRLLMLPTEQQLKNLLEYHQRQ